MSNVEVTTPSEAIGRLGEAIDKRDTVLTTQVGRNRKTLKWLVISVALDMVLTAGLGYDYFRTTGVATTQTVSCRDSNQIRASALKLWEKALTERAGPSGQTQDLIALAKQTYQPRKCQ